MCRQVTCRKCGKPTWAGCGQHVDQVLAGIPSADRCPGHPKETGSGFLVKLFGRRWLQPPPVPSPGRSWPAG